MSLERHFHEQQLANGYALVNGVQMHAENGDRFEIANSWFRKNVGTGHFAEVRIDSPRFSAHPDAPANCICPHCKEPDPEVATQFHELREEQIRFIASYLQASLDAGHYQPLKNVQTLARMFLYNFIVIGIIEELPEPLPFIKDMVDILMCSIT